MSADEHPDLTRAFADLAAGDAMGALRIALGAREAAAEGRYCDCVEPNLTPPDLMCGACLLNNEQMERAAVRRMSEGDR